MTVKFKLLLLIVVDLLFCYEAAPAKFYSVNQLYGISLREVNSVCSDAHGFVWASSKTGILRLTEDDYRIYHLPYANTNVITVKLVVEGANLVAYTNNGQIFLYDPVSDKFILIVDAGKVQDLEYLLVNNLVLDKNGAYWISTTQGVFRLQAGQFSLVYRSNGCRIAWYDENQLIIVRDEGIWMCDIRTLNYWCVYEDKSSMPDPVSSLYFDKQDNKLWLGTLSKGLFSFDFHTNALKGILKETFPKKPILDIEKNSESTLLIGIDGQGILELDKNDDRILGVYKESVDDPSSLKGNGVYDVFCDHNKRVWVCTYSGGLSFYDQTAPLVSHIVHQVNNKNSLVNNDVNSIIEDRFGKLWFATNNGISCWDVSANQWTRFYYEEHGDVQVFLALCEDDHGRIWAGSYSSGVYVLDAETGKELAHYINEDENSPLINNFIFDIFKDSQGDIWVGGVNGVFACYHTRGNRFRTYAREPISTFAEMSPDSILLGCSYGLVLLNKQTGNKDILAFGISVRSIFITGDEIWIGTGGDGLIKYNYRDKTTERFVTQSGLTSAFVNSVTFADNCLWLGTENGLCRFNPGDRSFVTYSSIYPLARTSFNDDSQFKLKNGQLAWGTNNGAVVFEPGALREMPSEGKIFFQELSVSGRSVHDEQTYDLKMPLDSLESISLGYHQNTISLELLPLRITTGAKFSWMLEGFDKDWSLPTENRILTYTNIPSGNFVLRIRLYDSSLSHVVAERVIAITVVPPFWKSLWFWGLVYAVLIGLVLLVLQYYIKTLNQKHTEEKVRFFTNTAHDIRTSLTLIKAPVEELSRETNLSESGRHYLNIAIEQARRLSTVVTQLMDFQKVDIGKEQMLFANIDIVEFVSMRIAMFESLAKSKHIKLVFNSDVKDLESAIDESKMEKVIDNLISNAIKYSHPEGSVVVDLKSDENGWTLVIKDHGIGIGKNVQRRLFNEFYRGDNAINSKVVGSGIGLLLVKNYVDMHKGTVSCQSQENIGSTFQIVIPYKEIEARSAPDGHFSVDEVGHDHFSVDVSLHIPTDEREATEPVMKVLVVEDNDDLLSFMKNTLSREFKVFTAANGTVAWEVLNRQMPDLIVSDIMMPGMDGFELCQKVKSTYETSHIPIVLLTALSEKTEQLRGLGLGADDYLTKPFDMNLLVHRIKSIIRNRGILRERALKLIKGDSSEPILSNELNDKFMKKMLDVARANIANAEFNKEEYASAMNVSSSLLYKKIKSLTNLSPTDFIKTVRLDHALELLQSRQHTVTEVSELCGFTSVGYFSTVFRKHFGKSPTEVLD
ncbi:MAG: two-component regulator propeller domain-containing protein [Breznakibacter sp.]